MNGNYADTASEDEVHDMIDDEQPPSPKEETEEEKRARAERTKEQGNVAFKAKRYGEALDLYSTAVGMCDLVLVSPYFPSSCIESQT